MVSCRFTELLFQQFLCLPVCSEVVVFKAEAFVRFSFFTFSSFIGIGVKLPLLGSPVLREPLRCVKCKVKFGVSYEL